MGIWKAEEMEVEFELGSIYSAFEGKIGSFDVEAML